MKINGNSIVVVVIIAVLVTAYLLITKSKPVYSSNYKKEIMVKDSIIEAREAALLDMKQENDSLVIRVGEYYTQVNSILESLDTTVVVNDSTLTEAMLWIKQYNSSLSVSQ